MSLPTNPESTDKGMARRELFSRSLAGQVHFAVSFSLKCKATENQVDGNAVAVTGMIRTYINIRTRLVFVCFGSQEKKALKGIGAL